MSPSLYYLRTRDGLEVDLLIEEGQQLHLFEVKSTATITQKHAVSLQRARRAFASIVKTTSIVSRSRNNALVASGIVNYAWKNILGR